MKATQRLREAGQSLWLDHITRALLASGTLAKRTYKGYRDLLASDRYVKSLAAPHSVDTMPEKTLLALADHGEIGPMLPHDGGDAEETLHRFTRAGIDLDALAAELQREGAAAFVKSWEELLACIGKKSATLRKAG